jgi:hypothetical protein
MLEASCAGGLETTRRHWLLAGVVESGLGSALAIGSTSDPLGNVIGATEFFTMSSTSSAYTSGYWFWWCLIASLRIGASLFMSTMGPSRSFGTHDARCHGCSSWSLPTYLNFGTSTATCRAIPCPLPPSVARSRITWMRRGRFRLTRGRPVRSRSTVLCGSRGCGSIIRHADAAGKKLIATGYDASWGAQAQVFSRIVRVRG